MSKDFFSAIIFTALAAEYFLKLIFCSKSFETKSTYGKEGDILKLDIDPISHPAWTGEASKLMDSDGQVAKFNKRFQNLNFKK